MPTRLKSVALSAAALFLFSCVAFAQVSSLEGDVKDENGQPLKGALVKIDRKDIKGHYQVKTDKKGHYFHTGLPLGTYKVTLEVDGKDVDNVDNVRTSLGDSQPINFDLQATKKRNQSLQQAAANGTMTKEQERGMSAEQKAALEKATKEREAALSKNKALNDAFNQGMTAMQGKQWDAAVDAFNKANELDPKQTVIWAHLGIPISSLAQPRPARIRRRPTPRVSKRSTRRSSSSPTTPAITITTLSPWSRPRRFPKLRLN